MKLFAGNIGRLNYFAQSIALLIVSITLYVVFIGSMFVGMAENQPIDMSILGGDLGTGFLVIVIIWLLTTIYGIAISAKRLRNIGHNPWWVLVGVIPYLNFAGWLYLCLRPGQQRIQAQKAQQARTVQ